MSRLAVLFAPMLLASCAAVPPPPASTSCPLASSDWRAWVNAMPGPDAQPRLIAVGKVTVPTGGWRFSWSEPQVLRSFPPQVVVELQAIPPAEAATQAVMTQEVRGEWPMQPPIGAFTVRCGGQVLARVEPVETAH